MDPNNSHNDTGRSSLHMNMLFMGSDLGANDRKLYKMDEE